VEFNDLIIDTSANVSIEAQVHVRIRQQCLVEEASELIVSPDATLEALQVLAVGLLNIQSLNSVNVGFDFHGNFSLSQPEGHSKTRNTNVSPLKTTTLSINSYEKLFTNIELGDTTVAIFIPSVTKSNTLLSHSTQEYYVDKAAYVLSSIAGGATSVSAQGYYIMKETGQLVKEKVTMVFAIVNSNDNTLEKCISAAMQLGRELLAEMDQEAILVKTGHRVVLIQRNESDKTA